jgi:Protein of unknown function (DUF3306)
MSNPKSFIQRWSRRKRAATADAGTRSHDSLTPSPRSSRGEGGVRGAHSIDEHSPSPGPRFARTRPLPASGEREEAEFAGRLSAQTPSTAHASTTANTTDDAGLKPGRADVPVDVTKLPPIESITAESDIRAFLAPGIPPELTRAALRRAWAADPKIRDFVGLSENSWDFNAPGAIAGFGPLEMTDELRRRIAQFVGRSVASDTADASPSMAGREAHAVIETPGVLNASDGDAATRQSPTSRTEPAKPEVELPGQLPHCDNGDLAKQCEPERRETESTVKGSHGRALPR